MKIVSELTYLGVEICADGKNMKTKINKRNKQTGKKKLIPSLIKTFGKIHFSLCPYIDQLNGTKQCSIPN